MVVTYPIKDGRSDSDRAPTRFAEILVRQFRVLWLAEPETPDQ